MAAALLLTVALFLPVTAQGQVTEPPPPLPERPLEFPEFQEFALENGLQVILLERDLHPVTSVALYLRRGSAADPADRIGRASMTADVLTQGTESRSARKIAEAIEGVGASLSASAGQDWTSVSTTTLAEHLPLALELVSDVARNPIFPEEEVELARTRTLSSLRASLGQASQVASRHFSRTVYGEDHPYGRNRTPETVSAIERDDLLRFHEESFHPDGAILVVAGAAERTEVEELVSRWFGDWEPGAAGAVAFPEPPSRGRTEISLLHRPGSAQVNIVVGHLGIRPDNPDYFPLLVMNRILGGGPDSRLFRILREEKGWTYGAYSQLTRGADVGVFRVQAEVRPEVADSSLAELLHQLERLRDDEVPGEEFEAARSYLAGSFPLRIETAAQVAGQIAQARLLGLPVEYVTEYRDRINEVTPDDVQRVAREYVHPDQAAVIVVGDATRLLPELEPFAPVALYDVEGDELTREDLDAPAVALDGNALREGTRSYTMRMQGSEAGTGRYTLRRDGDVWRAETSLSAAMMEQEQTLLFRMEDMAPISLESRTVQGGASMVMDLRVENGRLTGEAELPPQVGGDREFDMELEVGTILPGMDEYVLAATRLESGARISLPLVDVLQGGTTTVTFRVRDRESVEVPAGTFETYRVDVEGGPQPITLFLRVEAPHILVKQEWAGAPITLELTELEEPGPE